MAANNPLKGHFSGGQGRKRKRNEPQNLTSSLNSSALSLNSPNPKLYSIVDGILALAVFQGPVDYQLQLVDKDNAYIENTLCFTDKDVVQNIIIFIGNKNFSGLIKYLQDNSDSQSVNIIIGHIYRAAKSIIFTSMFLPIVDHFTYPPLQSLRGEFITSPAQMPISNSALVLPPLSALVKTADDAQRERLKLKKLARALSSAQVIYSGASASPVYRGLSPSVSAVKQDQRGDGAAFSSFPK
ncbi:MAG: hypothetical protein K0R24_1655 [Gammaproteobacteria bacterium]|nr:hypothetical protein [Gammaproteobacteria bacterium]